jgi:hypothetical protein
MLSLICEFATVVPFVPFRRAVRLKDWRLLLFYPIPERKSDNTATDERISQEIPTMQSLWL